MALFASQHPRGPEIAAPYLASPRREVRRLADVLEAYWARAIAPVWPRIRGFLEADIAYRARRLTTGGPAALFADLSPRVSWQQPDLDVQVPAHDATFDLDGRGLLLVPSAFAARPVVSDRAPWLPGVIYPARGIATLWEQAPAAPDGLARLIGARARACSPTSRPPARPPSSQTPLDSARPPPPTTSPPSSGRARHRPARRTIGPVRAHTAGRRAGHPITQPLPTVNPRRRSGAPTRTWGCAATNRARFKGRVRRVKPGQGVRPRSDLPALGFLAG